MSASLESRKKVLDKLIALDGASDDETGKEEAEESTDASSSKRKAADESGTKKKKAPKWESWEDCVLVEAIERFGRVKTYDIEIWTGETAKMARSAEEIANRIKNLWKSDNPYKDLYVRKACTSKAKDPKKLRAAEQKNSDTETENERIHNAVRKKLWKLKKEDSVSSTKPPEEGSDVHADFMEAGAKRKAERTSKWDDVKTTLEAQRVGQSNALKVMEDLAKNLAESRDEEKKVNASLLTLLEMKVEKMRREMEKEEKLNS